MKTCPQCAKTYPDSEQFCQADGTALIGAESETSIQCPVCGGKAEPGEVMCNFCGARLDNPQAAAPPPPATAAPGSSATRRVSTTQRTFYDEPPPERLDEEERSSFGTAGYVIAALVALAAGAWFALHLSRGAPGPVAEASPTPMASPAAAPGPMVVLADKLGIQVTGESASAPERDQSAARKLFGDSSSTLLDVYKRALAGDTTLHDGMEVRLTVVPSGEVTGGKVMISTAPNPSLDEESIKAMMGWKFGPFGGSAVEVDYPVIFARTESERGDIESALADKMAHLSPAEAPEYASSPAPTPAAVVAAPTPAAVAALPPPEEAVHPRPKPKKLLPPPKPSTRELVQNRLRQDRRFSRVKFYTDNGTVTLFGKVFDDSTKGAAERAVRGVDGVTNVVDTLTTDQGEWADNESRINRELQNSGLSTVKAKVIGSDAYLDGQVTTDSERQRAVTITEQTAAVKVRTNLIRVVPGSIF